MKKIPALFPFLFSFVFLWGSSPVPYSGKMDIGGVNYFGQAQFTFSLHDGNGTTFWRNGSQAGETIQVPVHNGRYTVLLGGQGMTPFPPKLFLDQDKLYLKVHVDTNDSTGLNHLAPDQMISATPRALAAEWAKMAEGVTPGAITRAMLSAEVLADLNSSGSDSDSNATFTPTPGSITRSMLASDVLTDLNQSIKTITRDMLPASVLTDLNRTITKSMLGQDVLTDLNTTLAVGSVSRDKLSADILADLNKTITRDMLPASVLTDLNRTITKSMLGSDVLADLNRTVTPQMIQSSSITTAQLNEQILKYLKPEITLHPQAPGLIFSGQSLSLTSQAQEST